jgi:histidine ammonia-lyase
MHPTPNGENPVVLDGEHLTLNEVVAIADGTPAQLAADAVPRMERSRAAVEQFLARGEVVYGVTTGFGFFKDRVIPPDQVLALQRNLVRSHAAGVGPLLSEREVRAMLAVRANTLAKGYSGVRPLVVETLIAMLNGGVHPVVPSQGSLGASGDLAPLAHLALVVIGEGEAFYRGERMRGGDALRRAGIAPLELQAKEGLALLNGTALMTGVGALVTQRAELLAQTADIAGCLSLEALHGTVEAFDERLHAVRPHPRQVDCAAYLRRLLARSTFVRERDPLNVQDPYTLRCIPQVHGAVRDAIAYARWVIEIELNAATDNPLIFCDDEEPCVISGGNFHGEPLALAMDYLAMALTDLGNMSERRTARLVDTTANGGVLPPFLTRHGGLQSGFMIAQYTAAALAADNKVLAHPASADNITASANVEDHNSLGATATLKARRLMTNVETIVAIELLLAAQGIDLRRESMSSRGAGARLGQGTGAAYALIREHIPFADEDRPLAPLIERVRQLVWEGAVARAVSGL